MEGHLSVRPYRASVQQVSAALSHPNSDIREPSFADFLNESAVKIVFLFHHPERASNFAAFEPRGQRQWFEFISCDGIPIRSAFKMLFFLASVRSQFPTGVRISQPFGQQVRRVNHQRQLLPSGQLSIVCLPFCPKQSQQSPGVRGPEPPGQRQRQRQQRRRQVRRGGTGDAARVLLPADRQLPQQAQHGGLPPPCLFHLICFSKQTLLTVFASSAMEFSEGLFYIDRQLPQQAQHGGLPPPVCFISFASPTRRYFAVLASFCDGVSGGLSASL